MRNISPQHTVNNNLSAQECMIQNEELKEFLICFKDIFLNKDILSVLSDWLPFLIMFTQDAMETVLFLWRWRIHSGWLCQAACPLHLGEEHWQPGQDPARHTWRAPVRCSGESWASFGRGHCQSSNDEKLYEVLSSLDTFLVNLYSGIRSGR